MSLIVINCDVVLMRRSRGKSSSAASAEAFSSTCSSNLSAPCLGSLRFSGSVLSSVSLSSLLPHHAQFHLAQLPPPQPPRSHGSVDAKLVSYSARVRHDDDGTTRLGASAESANNTEFTPVIFLLGKQRNAELPVQIFPRFSRPLMVL